MPNNDQQALHHQAEALYERYGRPLEREHWGEYVVISPEGKIIIAPTLIAIAQKAETALGRGGFAFKIGERAIATWK